MAEIMVRGMGFEPVAVLGLGVCYVCAADGWLLFLITSACSLLIPRHRILYPSTIKSVGMSLICSFSIIFTASEYGRWPFRLIYSSILFLTCSTLSSLTRLSPKIMYPRGFFATRASFAASTEVPTLAANSL